MTYSSAFNVVGTPELCAHWGYPCQSYSFNTSDNYKLQVHRIPNQKSSALPILLWHGLSNCSELFVSSSPARSLAFVLHDAGFDVWLANTRGNKYSFGHSKLDLNTWSGLSEYWSYSIDHLAEYDLPATVDFILNFTNSPKLNYIGFSQGSAIAFAALALDEELNHKINHVFGLAPAMKPKKIPNDFFNSIPPNYFYYFLGNGSFVPFVQHFHRIPAGIHINRSIIKSAMKLIFKWDLDKLGTTDRELLLFQNVFSPTSVQNFVHWFQILSNDRFAPYDRGDQPYRSVPLLAYPTKHITSKLTLYCGNLDNIADIEYLENALPCHTNIHFRDYEHLDFVWAVDAKEQVWDEIISIMNAETQADLAVNKFHTLGEDYSDIMNENIKTVPSSSPNQSLFGIIETESNITEKTILNQIEDILDDINLEDNIDEHRNVQQNSNCYDEKVSIDMIPVDSIANPHNQKLDDYALAADS
ncbi:Alpha/Beta hydrolase protein [Globomyces pollinis-pini]|nr:Alpha/Beta hydrolase protein [Globomyces pollinis-pini]